jgi:hypothetical protein
LYLICKIFILDALPSRYSSGMSYVYINRKAPVRCRGFLYLLYTV